MTSFRTEEEEGIPLNQPEPHSTVIKRVVETRNTDDQKHGTEYFFLDNGEERQLPFDKIDPIHRSYKRRLISTEAATFFFFLVFGILAFAAAVVETDLGTGTWPIGRTGMIAVTSIYGSVGAILLIYYVFCQVKFTKFGEEQIDDLIANSLGQITMYVVSMGLLGKYFMLTIDNSTDDYSLRRMLYIVFEVFALMGAIFAARAMTRHAAVHRRVVIGQTWRTGGMHLIHDNPTTRTERFVHEYFAQAGIARYVFTGLMITYTLTLLGFTIWLLVVGGVAVDKVPPFDDIYLSYFVTMGVLLIILWGVWIAWSVMSKVLKGSFAAHFDVYYLTHTIVPVVVIFMLIGYHYTYSKVPDNYLDDPPVTVPTLKFAYFQKIVAVQLILLPLLAVGIAKGGAMLSNMYPVDIHIWGEVQKSLTQRK